jgi:hypothetical protein
LPLLTLVWEGGHVDRREDAMTHLRRSVLAALTVAMCAVPVAAADGSTEHGRSAAVVPVHQVAGTPAGEFIGANFARFYATPVGEIPPPPCQTVGDKHQALVMGPTGETNACTVDRHTQLVIFGLGSACSDVEPDPFFGADEAAQRACVVAFDHEFVTALSVTVDDDAPVDFRTGRFEVISPQQSVQVPPDSALGLPAGPATLVAHAWMAQLRTLRPGQHTVSVDVVTTDFAITSTFILTVLPDGSND